MAVKNNAVSLMTSWTKNTLKKEASFDYTQDDFVSVTCKGESLFLKLAGTWQTLIIFMPLLSLDFEQDNELIALSMMLNLEPGLMCGAALGLDAQNKQLVLTMHQEISHFDEHMLNRWIDNMINLGLHVKDELRLVSKRNNHDSVKNSRMSPAFRSFG